MSGDISIINIGGRWAVVATYPTRSCFPYLFDTREAALDACAKTFGDPLGAVPPLRTQDTWINTAGVFVVRFP